MEFRKKIIKLSIAINLGLLIISPALSQTIDVSNSQQLTQALDNASGGETIRLASGNYAGSSQDSSEYRISGRNYSSYVTITSANAANPANFKSIFIAGSSYLRLDKLKIDGGGRQGLGIFNGSHHIEALNLKIDGVNRFDRSEPHYSQVTSLYGVYINGSLRELVDDGYPIAPVSDVRLENTDVQDIKSSAYLFTNFKDSLVRGNYCDWVASDCYKLANVDNLDFVNNFGASNIHSSPTAHVDFVQGQGPVSNSRFIGNVALAVSDQHFQGLFFDDATYTNLTFENNLIHAPSIRGISVSSPRNGTASSGIVARFNTILRPAVPAEQKSSNKASLILIPSGSVSENNIVANITTKTAQRLSGAVGKQNVVSQYDKSANGFHYNNYYVNAARGRGATIKDFAPIAGSYGATKGAFARIRELLNDSTGDPVDPSDPVDPVTPRQPSSIDLVPVIMMLLED